MTNDSASPIRVGDFIEYKLMPGFRMEVLEVAPCEPSPVRPEPHDQYKVIDPEGNEDWLCAHDVRKVG